MQIYSDWTDILIVGEIKMLHNLHYDINVNLNVLCVSRHIQGCSAWWWTLTRTCPSTQSPSWRCTAAKNATRCPRTSTPYQRPPIAACYKVLNTICDLWHCSSPLHLLSALHPVCDLWSLSHTKNSKVWCIFLPRGRYQKPLKVKTNSYFSQQWIPGVALLVTNRFSSIVCILWWW